MDGNTHTPSAAPPVRLIDLAAELETTPAELERRLGRDVYHDATGFRVITNHRAAALFAERDAQRAKAEADARAHAEEARARHREVRERALAEKANQEPRVVRFDLAATPIPGYMDAGALPVARMTARGSKHFEGAPSTRRPSAVDWLSGAAEKAGGVFGGGRKSKGGGK